MNIFAVGVNHRTAPIDVRDELHLSPEEIERSLIDLKKSLLKEAMIISTCNRTELYGIPYDDDTDGIALRNYLLNIKPNIHLKEDHVFRLFTCSAANHLLKVAAGIDSLVIGDVQVLNQVKEAYELAVKTETTGNVFHHLLHTALHTGKRVRTETTLGIGAVSISFAAVELAKKIFEDLHHKKVLLIGLGETGTLTARHLIDKGVEHLFVTNRTRARADAIANEYRARVIDYDDFPAAIHDVDIVITATSSETFIVTVEIVKSAMKKRLNRPLLIIDIATPRNTDPKANEVSNVFLKDIDSLQYIVDRNLVKRQEEIPKAQIIIAEELANFFIWFNSLEAAPTITQLRDKFENIRASEIQRFKNKFDEKSFDVVEIITKRIINKLLHPTMVSLRNPAVNGNRLETKVELLKDLFALEEDQMKNEEQNRE